MRTRGEDRLRVTLIGNAPGRNDPVGSRCRIRAPGECRCAASETFLVVAHHDQQDPLAIRQTQQGQRSDHSISCGSAAPAGHARCEHAKARHGTQQPAETNARSVPLSDRLTWFSLPAAPQFPRMTCGAQSGDQPPVQQLQTASQRAPHSLNAPHAANVLGLVASMPLATQPPCLTSSRACCCHGLHSAALPASS